MAKRTRSPPLPSCYRNRRPSELDPGNQKESAGNGVDYGNCRNRGDDSFVPYVEHHDGRKFFSDRFYLNATERTSVSPSKEPQHERGHNRDFERSDCDCDSRSLQDPPAFPLVDFVNQSLDVKAAVMGTFHIHPEWFRRNFPRFGELRTQHKSCDERETAQSDRNISVANNNSNTIPTLILHGHRGLEKALAKRVKEADETEYETDREEESSGDNSNKRHSLRPIDRIDDNSSSKFRFFLPATAKATETARHFVDNPYLKLCQVHCNWEKSEPNETAKTLSHRVSSEKENSEKETERKPKKTRESTFGVHHPKFLLLFEKSGDLVVIVTTSNLTPTNQTTVEGSWVQRFRPRSRMEHHANNQQHRQEKNDFGSVLQDFLLQLSKAAAAGTKQTGVSVTPSVPLANSIENRRTRDSSGSNHRFPLEEFLSKHIGLKSLSDFSSLYHFETARAYLVPTVPGSYKYDPENSFTGDGNHKATASRSYYGRQRVRYILDKFATSAPKISKKTQDASKSDHLLLQPTSLGGGWSRSQFASLIREYMGYYGGYGGGNNNNSNSNNNNATSTKTKSHKKQKTNNDHPYHRDDFWVCRQADIVWPSDRFMIDVAESTQSLQSSTKIISPLQAASTTTMDRNDFNSSPAKTRVVNSFAFNSSKTFNTCDLEFIARMAKYQPNKPCQSFHTNTHQSNQNSSDDAANASEVVGPKAPHFKSIARLFPNHVAMKKRDVPPADAYFSWFLLTSACLSMGAQGTVVESNSSQPSSWPSSSIASTVAYRNFELGVLFVSHLPKKPKSPSKTNDFSGINSGPEQEKQERSVVYCIHPHRSICGDKQASDGNTKSTHAGDRNHRFSSSFSSPQLVHLPVPYNPRPESYIQKPNEEYEDDDDDDDDDADIVMKENPFFHEICNESRCIGNMLLTPFGRHESNRKEL